MRTTDKFGIHFKIRSERVKDGKAPVYVGITVNGEKAYMALKNFQAATDHWNLERGCGKATTKTGKEINAYLDEIRLIIKGHYKDLELSGSTITINALKDLFLGNAGEGSSFTF